MGKKKKKQSAQQRTADPGLSRGVLSTVLIVFAIITALSLFESAGDLGALIDYVLSAVFGVSKYVGPILLLLFAWMVMKEEEARYQGTHIIGAVLFLLSFSSLFHFHFPLIEMYHEAIEGSGGGLFGMLAWPMKRYLGNIAGVVLLIGILWISLLLIFNTTIANFILVHKKLMQSLGGFGAGLTAMSKELFVSNTHSDTTDEEADDYFEEQDDDSYLETIEKRNFAPKHHEEIEPDSTPLEPEVVLTKDTTSTTVTLKEQGKSGVNEADYMQNVIIKKIPPISLLSSEKSNPTSGDIKANLELIQKTFADFNIDVDMGKVRVGPTVTQYTLKPPRGVKLTKITGLTSNLALALAAHPIRMEAPIPGKSLVGIEVPNEKAAQVTLKELLESSEFKTREHNMMVALGRDVTGKVWFADLPKMPHLLIAGATGSGKTVCMNTIIMSLLYQNTAETLRLIMVDPKRVELTPYNGIPHLLTPVITDVPKTVNALKWTVDEMNRRFEMLSKVGNRDIGSYNAEHPNEKLPYIVFIIDELADLMQMASNEVEAGIIRLAQMARAVGIHLIVATQRPSVDVITGLMKANIPGRIAFSVASSTDSRTILDSPGAESLLGKGDMLLSTANLSKPVRIQGAFLSEKEARNVISYLRVENEEDIYDESVIAKKDGHGGGQGDLFGGSGDEYDPHFEEAKRIVIDAGKASASYLQRRLRVGYARAARILDELEIAGVIGPADGSKPRELLMTEQDIDPTMDAGGHMNVFKKTESREIPPTPEPPPEADEDPFDAEDDDDADDTADIYEQDDFVAPEGTDEDETFASDEDEDMLDNDSEYDDTENEETDDDDADDTPSPSYRRELFR
jgi:S-DNA-T family DNA segregation ATPase FtsK/SpoIIIE